MTLIALDNVAIPFIKLTEYFMADFLWMCRNFKELTMTKASQTCVCVCVWFMHDIAPKAYSIEH